MKRCSICGLSKEEGQFFYRNRHTEKLHAQCKSCYIERRRKMWKDHYHKYGSEYRRRAVERNTRLKIKLRARMTEYLLDKSCAVCGINDPRVLEFDHIDPLTKEFTIARAMHNIVNWERLLAEIRKCQILCANCHKIKTANEQGWYKNLA